MNRRNWNRAKLDEYLKRDYCCKFLCFTIYYDGFVKQHDNAIIERPCGEEKGGGVHLEALALIPLKVFFFFFFFFFREKMLISDVRGNQSD